MMQPVLVHRRRCLADAVVDGRLPASPPGLVDRRAHHLPADAGAGQEIFPVGQDIALDARIRKGVLWRLTQHVPSPLTR